MEMAVETVLKRTDVVARAKALKHVDSSATLRDIGLHWLQIITALWFFYLFPVWWLYIPVILFVSARQYGMAILLHDAQHTLLHCNKSLNGWLATWLIAAPLGTDFEGSQRSHLSHHFHL